jgi:hypothetical protein
MRITGWRVRAEDREEWSAIVEQTKTHPGLWSRQKKKKKKNWKYLNNLGLFIYFFS